MNAARRAVLTPEKENSNHKHHRFLHKADNNYTRTHALLHLDPHTGQLPSSINMDQKFIELVEESIDPPESRWQDVWSHATKHYYENNKAQWYNQLFDTLTVNMLALISVIETSGQMNAFTAASFRDNVNDHKVMFSADPVVSYESFPYLLLVYRNLLEAAVKITTAQNIQQELGKISFLLSYPQKTEYRASYSLNARYSRDMNVGGSTMRTRHFLVGYRVGESRVVGPAGRHALFLRKLMISTLHSNFDVPPNGANRLGLMCQINLV